MLYEMKKVTNVHHYDLGNHFTLEVSKVKDASGEVWEAYLSHDSYGIKTFVYGVDGSEDLGMFLNDIEQMLYDPDLPETFSEEYFRQIDAIEKSNEKQFELEW